MTYSTAEAHYSNNNYNTGGHLMGLLATRRLIKSLLRSDHELQLSIYLARSNSNAETIIRSLHRHSFIDLQEAENYLTNQTVMLTEPKDPIPVNHSYNRTRRTLNLDFDIINPTRDFNLIIITVELSGNLFVFDIKDIDNSKMVEFDGLNLSYQL